MSLDSPPETSLDEKGDCDADASLDSTPLTPDPDSLVRTLDGGVTHDQAAQILSILSQSQAAVDLADNPAEWQMFMNRTVAQRLVGGMGAGESYTAEEAEQVFAVLRKSHADETLRGYRSNWRKFARWCRDNDKIALPVAPNTLVLYLVLHADTVDSTGARQYAPDTLQRWIAAINWVHRNRNFDKPGDAAIVKDTMSGIRRTYAEEGHTASPRSALEGDDLQAILEHARRKANDGGWLKQLVVQRDSAILLIGLLGALRREELASIRTGDVVRDRYDGLHIRLPASKTDQEGRGQKVAIPYDSDPDLCTPCAYMRWLRLLAAWESAAPDRSSQLSAVIRAVAESSVLTGHVCRGTLPQLPANTPLFRAIRRNGNLGEQAMTGRTVYNIVVNRATAAGIDEQVLANLGAHSLRAGFVTHNIRRGKSIPQIMKQTRHRDPRTVMRYDRNRNLLSNNAVSDFFKKDKNGD